METVVYAEPLLCYHRIENSHLNDVKQFLAVIQNATYKRVMSTHVLGPDMTITLLFDGSALIKLSEI